MGWLKGSGQAIVNLGNDPVEANRIIPATMKDTIMANAEQALPRAHDLIVYGASGFTGRLVAEHLLGTWLRSQPHHLQPRMPRPP